MTDSTENTSPAPCSKDPSVGAQITFDGFEPPEDYCLRNEIRRGANLTPEQPADPAASGEPRAALKVDSLNAAPSEAERGAVITARGTGEGLVLRLDGCAEPHVLQTALIDFMEARRTFLGGQAICLEWVGIKPEDAYIEETKRLLLERFNVSVKVSRLYERGKVALAEKDQMEGRSVSGINAASAKRDSRGSAAGNQAEAETYNLARSPSLFDGMQVLAQDLEAPGPCAAKTSFSAKDAAALWDDADCRVIYATLRSGQRVESEHSIVVFGDVNSGAEVIAGGDIIVLGTLRGVAHAGAYDETGGGRVIFALNFQPTQLRIGGIISRGAPESRDQPEIARVDGTLIVVEPYQARGINWRRGK